MSYDPTTDYAAQADEFIAEYGTDALIEEMRAKVQNGGRTILGTTNTHVVLRHIDALADRVASLTAERDEAREERDVSRWSLLARAVRAETALRELVEAVEGEWYSDNGPETRKALKSARDLLAVSSASEAETEREANPNICGNCGHSRELHFRADAYVPGKCDFQYDLCGCRNFVPASGLSASGETE